MVHALTHPLTHLLNYSLRNIDDYYPVVSADYENEMINWLHENNAIIHNDIEIKNISDNERGTFILTHSLTHSLIHLSIHSFIRLQVFLL